MQNIVSIVDTLPHHLRELAANIRHEDEREILAFGLSPNKALWRSYKASIYTKTALIDGKVAGVWGVAGTFMGDVGEPWFITTHEIKKISPLRIARDYMREVQKMLEMFDKFENFVDARYDSAIRLLDIAGFTLYDASPLEENGYLFRKFEMRK